MSRIATIIATRGRADLVDELWQQMREWKIPTYIVDAGGPRDEQHNNTSLWYRDEPFRGKCYAHNEGIKLIQKRPEKYDYYWICHNDVRFESLRYSDRKGLMTPPQVLMEQLDRNPHIGILSPCENASYPDSAPRTDDFHIVSTCDYLGFVIRADIANRMYMFLNPAFVYCWGAIHELSYKMSLEKKYIAYSDRVMMKHLGGSTYGKVKGAISREEYQSRAKQWAANYFRKTYGPRWDDKFSEHMHPSVRINTFREHRKLWESAE